MSSVNTTRESKSHVNQSVSFDDIASISLKFIGVLVLIGVFSVGALMVLGELMNLVHILGYGY